MSQRPEIVLILLNVLGCRAKTVGRFASNISNARGASGSSASPAINVQGSNQSAGASHRVKKERKKSVLPFHQRRSVATERSPTPPITVAANLKGISRTSTENTSEGRITEKPILSPPHLQIQTKDMPMHLEAGSDQNIKYLQTQSTCNTKTTFCESKPSYGKATLKYESKIVDDKRPDYLLPMNLMPKRPTLSADLLESRTLSSDLSYTSLYAKPASYDNDVSITGVISPIMLSSPVGNPGEMLVDPEVRIIRMPNKG